ncbi:MAG: prolipoprotein diacylglyceryl transferase [Lachnospiraceae bacterium]|nr:prolipoprotein diacylglyceryl transferase [Lachnospiraceae bacterium]
MCPIIFSYGDFQISGYWFMTVLGLLAVFIYLNFANSRLEQERRLPFYHIVSLFANCIISILAGGTLMGFLVNLPGIIENWAYYSANPGMILEVAFTSLVFYGGALMLILLQWLYTRHYELDGQTVIELFVPATPLFMSIARIGCFLGGCCYGIEVSWGVVFPEGSLAPAGVPLFPSQLVEAAGHLLLFLLLLAVKDRLKKKSDLLFLYMGAYAALRFILEFFRGDAARGIWFGLSTSQWISLGLLLAVVIHALKSRRKTNKILT